MVHKNRRNVGGFDCIENLNHMCYDYKDGKEKSRERTTIKTEMVAIDVP